VTLNISFIHILETITLLLIIGKLCQIRKLYYQSNTSTLNSTKRNLKTSSSSLARKTELRKIAARKLESRNSEPRKSALLKTNGIYNRFAVNHSQHNLPLPEVSFTEGLPLLEVSFSSKDDGLHFSSKKSQSKKKPQSKNKAPSKHNAKLQHKLILNNYIEDFFFESSTEVLHEAEVVDLRNYKVDSTAEDEFITVIDEHDEVVRAFDSLEKNIYLVR
jgi:hypothetical protein